MTRVKVIPEGMEIPRLSQIAAKSRRGQAIEALTSHVVALARLHRVRPRRLYDILLCSQAGDARLTNARTHEAKLNGWGPWASAVSNAVEEFTQTAGARTMTLLGADSLLSVHHQRFLRRCRAWCPKCYLEQRAQGDDAWDNLYTYLQSTEVCIFHHVLLRHSCPSCRTSQPFIPRIPFLDNCDTCGADLAVEVDAAPPGKLWLQQHCWFARCGERFVASLHGQDPLSVEHARGHLRSLAALYFGGQFGAMHTGLGLATRGLSQFMKHNKSASWSFLLEISYKLQLAPDRLLSAQGELTEPEAWQLWSPVSPARWGRNMADFVEALRQALVAELNSPPDEAPRRASDICRMIGIKLNVLVAHFPEETFQLTARHRAWIASRGRRI